MLETVPRCGRTSISVAQAAGASASGVFGQVAFAYDISHISGSDLARIIPIVAILIGMLLAIVLRSLVAPLYLVASIVLSYLAALGLVGIVFVHLGGQDGINFILPFLMFVFLMALGSDYNILIMSRIREEAHDAPAARCRGPGDRPDRQHDHDGRGDPRRHLRGPGRRRRLGRRRSDPADRLRRCRWAS